MFMNFSANADEKPCTPDDRINLGRHGFTISEINEICFKNTPNSPVQDTKKIKNLETVTIQKTLLDKFRKDYIAKAVKLRELEKKLEECTPKKSSLPANNSGVSH